MIRYVKLGIIWKVLVLFNIVCVDVVMKYGFICLVSVFRKVVWFSFDELVCCVWVMMYFVVYVVKFGFVMFCMEKCCFRVYDVNEEVSFVVLIVFFNLFWWEIVLVVYYVLRRFKDWIWNFLRFFVW